MEDGEEEFEEQLVLVELSGIIDNDFLHKSENKCKILGLDTEKPVMQIGHYFFSGNYEDMVGTAVLLEETKPEEESSEKEGLKLAAITRKTLCMKRTFLNKKFSAENSGDMRDIGEGYPATASPVLRLVSCVIGFPIMSRVPFGARPLHHCSPFCDRPTFEWAG